MILREEQYYGRNGDRICDRKTDKDEVDQEIERSFRWKKRDGIESQRASAR